MYTKVGCTHICICTDVRQCTVLLKCTYSYLKKYMYLKSFFIQKYPLLIWLCIHFLQPSLEDRKRPGPEAGEDATSSGLHNSFLWPLLPCLYVEEVGGEWSYIFCFPQLLPLYHGRVSIPFFITDSIAQWLRR